MENNAAGTPEKANLDEVKLIASAVSRWFVRRDSKFYEVDNPTAKLSLDDCKRISLFRVREEFPDLRPESETLARAFDLAIERKHSQPGRTVPVWTGGFVCKPGHEERCVWERGQVQINRWRAPKYRDVPAQPSLGLAGEFFDAVFTREDEKEKFLDWLSWSL